MKTQAWGWLAAGVLAAALNASYHDGGLRWAHRLTASIGHRSAAALALATGNADRFVTEARILTAHESASPCRFSTALARVEPEIARVDLRIARFQAMSDRQQAQLARLEANRARIEAQVQARIARVRIPEAAFSPVVVELPKSIACPRITVPRVAVPRVTIPPMPAIRIPAPSVHVGDGGSV